ncbi:hypothetical protein DN069_19385 [Streptacidiphilus pinicola]|uniref:Uncharacterized protein n=1 Tax=Streptacidiphilus pinicola TaxID=2219663 RepID=A0A2X0K3T4_9ACTN|nr:hypothetical protein [Streptacidiphilus pinicola]RAG83925.1 hypothetical protein DN069_19385 [Streptacidiphilus pinicola]
MALTTQQELPDPDPGGFPPEAQAPDTPASAGHPDGGDPDGVCDEWARALVAEAVTCRPVGEVSDLLALLRTDQRGAVVSALGVLAAGRPVEDLVELVVALRSTQPSLADELVRAVVVSRPVEEVARLLALVAVPGSDDAKVALRTAALGRPVWDVARLAGILHMPDPPDSAAPLEDEGEQAPTPTTEGPSATGNGGSSRAVRRASRRRADRPVRTALGWLAAGVLLLGGALHVPAVRTGWGQWPVANTLLTLLVCLCVCYAILVLRRGDSRAAWAGYAVVAALMISVDVANRQAQLALGPDAAHWLDRVSTTALVTGAIALLLATVRLVLGPARQGSDASLPGASAPPRPGAYEAL